MKQEGGSRENSGKRKVLSLSGSEVPFLGLDQPKARL